MFGPVPVSYEFQATGCFSGIVPSATQSDAWDCAIRSGRVELSSSQGGRHKKSDHHKESAREDASASSS